MKLADARAQFSKVRRPPAPVDLCASCIDAPACKLARTSGARPVIDCHSHRPKPDRGLCETCLAEFSCDKAHQSGRVEFCDKHRSVATLAEPGA